MTDSQSKPLSSESRPILMVSTASGPPHVGGTFRTTKVMRWLPAVGYRPTLLTIARYRLPNPGVPRYPDDSENIYRVECRRLIDRLQGKTSPLWGSATDAKAQTLRRNRSIMTSLTRALRRFLYNVLEYPDPTAAWIRAGFMAGLRLAEETPFRLIYSSAGVGVSGHFVAARLKGYLGIPWVHEYRDLWGNNPWRGILPYEWRARRERSAERRFLERADRCIVLNPGAARILSARHNEEFSERIRVVANGFDPSEFPANAGPPLGLPLRLCYTGILYGGKRDPSGIFRGIRILIEEGAATANDFEFVYAGRDGEVVMAAARSVGLDRVLLNQGIVSAHRAKELQAESHVLCLLENAEDDEWVKTNLPGKASEYMAAQRPVLVLAHPEGAIADLVREAKIGVCFHPTDVGGIARELSSYVSAARKKEALPYAPDEAVVRRYRWDSIAVQLAGCFDELLGQQVREPGPR